jgi:hypothetical protein
MSDQNLPALPATHEWSVTEFQSNESQWHPRGSRVVISVRKRYKFAGIKFTLRDVDYPAYVVDPLKGEALLNEIAELILQRHNKKLSNRQGTAA